MESVKQLNDERLRKILGYFGNKIFSFYKNIKNLTANEEVMIAMMSTMMTTEKPAIKSELVEMNLESASQNGTRKTKRSDNTMLVELMLDLYESLKRANESNYERNLTEIYPEGSEIFEKMNELRSALHENIVNFLEEKPLPDEQTQLKFGRANKILLSVIGLFHKEQKKEVVDLKIQALRRIARRVVKNFLSRRETSTTQDDQKFEPRISAENEVAENTRSNGAKNLEAFLIFFLEVFGALFALGIGLWSHLEQDWFEI
jgi:hypothetical protein